MPIDWRQAIIDNDPIVDVYEEGHICIWCREDGWHWQKVSYHKKDCIYQMAVDEQKEEQESKNGISNPT